MGNCTSVGPTVVLPKSLMSCTQRAWSLRSFAESPMTFTLRFAHSGALSYRTHLNTDAPQHRHRRAIDSLARDLRELGRAHRGEVARVREEDRLGASGRRSAVVDRAYGFAIPMALTQESPIHSWNLIGPCVVSASKSGAMLPKRSVDGIVSTGLSCSSDGEEDVIKASHCPLEVYISHVCGRGRGRRV